MRSKLACLAAALLVAIPAVAAPPRTLDYQGFLTSSTDAPIDAPVQMTFRIYNAPTGGAALWSETQPALMVTKGEFSTSLGLVTPLTLAFDVPYYLGVTVGSDPEMTPRQALAASAYAFRALALDGAVTLPGSILTGSIPTATVPGTQITGAISTATVPGSQVTGDLTGVSDIVLPDSTASVGNIVKNGTVFMHNFGVHNTFLGAGAGSFASAAATGNTGIGAGALANATAGDNIAIGFNALHADQTGDTNIAIGNSALQVSTGAANLAVGHFALLGTTSGISNTALGNAAMAFNSAGSNNTVIGQGAMSGSSTGNSNTAVGIGALSIVQSGSNNIAVGAQAGSQVANSSDNIDIGNPGMAGDSGAIRIGTSGTQSTAFLAGVTGVTTGLAGVAVLVDANGQLGTITSSRSVKEDIADMGDASDILMRLRPVTFRYKQRPGWPLQYGLIAEEVAEVAPDLAARGPDGKIQTVYYQDLPPMLLNEYQKQQRVIDEQRAQLAAEHARVDALERELATLKARLGWD